MKNYPEPEGRIWDIVEGILSCAVAGLLGLCVYLALYFSAIILEGVK